MATVRELIHRYEPEILSAWTRGAQQAVSARALSPAELSGLMPRYLGLLGHLDPGSSAGLSEAQLELVETHLGNRLSEGFDLHEMITEFAILARCVAAVLDAVPEVERPSAGDVAQLFSELYQTSAAVTKIFNEHLLEDEQTMKRCSRLLDRLALAPPSAVDSAHHGLDEVLAVVIEVMAARAVVMLLVDSSGERPTTVAARGAGSPELELHARSLEATVFADASATVDSATGGLPLPATLVRGGVGDLLRVGHPGRGALRGALYIATAAERPFTASEQRRAEGLCRALTLHLENAQLHAALGEKLDELRGEREHRERMIAILVRAVRGPLASARSNAGRLLHEPRGLSPAAIEVIEALARLERVVDDLLATTPAVRSELPR